MSETPLWDAVERFRKKKRSAFHMPGHKYNPPYDMGVLFDHDITEVEGVDSLYHAAGPILKTEKNYARLYGSRASFLSAGGSTLCIQAMLALVAPRGKKVILSRMVHSSAVAAMALLGLEPHWIWPKVAQTPEEGLPGMALPITIRQISAALNECPDAAAVYLTSPDYMGQTEPIPAIAQLCKAAGVPLLVDNAHGAHLPFLAGWEHPIRQGADMCCDSLHKTLPVLTGAAMLHVADPDFVPCARQAMALFGSTSPSYPIMLSADLAFPYLKHSYAQEAAPVAAELNRLRRELKNQGFALAKTEPMRITLEFRSLGYDDAEFGHWLRSHKVEPEFLEGGVCVLLASPRSTLKDIANLETALRQLPRLEPRKPLTFLPQPPPVRMTMRQAALAPRAVLPLGEKLVGRIAALPVSTCPPGIPLVVPGEEITPGLLLHLKKSGVKNLCVVQ